MQTQLLATCRWRADSRTVKASPAFFVSLTFALTACSPYLAVSPPKGDASVDASVNPGTDAGPQADAGLAMAEACNALNASRCKYLARCGLIEYSSASLESCARQLDATWCGPTTWPEHVTRGALRYDAVKAQSCSQAFATLTCTEWEQLPESCTSFLRPRAQLGEPCFDGYTECIDGVCRGNPSGCPRVCQPRGLLDEGCLVDADCRAGLACRFPSFVSVVGTCGSMPGEGDTCDPRVGCPAGFLCADARCRSLPGNGLPCLENLCNPLTYCDSTPDGGMCVTRKQTGEACDTAQCDSASFCGMQSQHCEPIAVSVGDSCVPQQRCPAGAVCLGGGAATIPGHCGSPLGFGESCVAATDCQSHLACLGGDAGKNCQPRAPTGASCTSSSECRVSAICTGGRCVELPLPSESCAETHACRWGLCRELAGPDGGSVCGALLSAGQTCTRDRQCASGTCNQGTCLARCVP